MSSVVDEPITITWEITSETTTTITKDLFDIVLITPNGSASYVVDPMTAFIAPTLTTVGSMTYTFTPTSPGSWTIRLVTGDASAYTVLDEFLIKALCAIPTIVPDLRALGATRFAAKDNCGGPTPIVFDGVSTTAWWAIYGIGRHATDTSKLVFVGKPTGDLSDLAIGILDRNTGIITTLADPFGSIGGTDMDKCSGIDCDPATGVYATQITQGIGGDGFNSVYWSTDLATWTKSTESGFDTQFNDFGFSLNFDIDLGLWVWMSDQPGRVFTSSDGKTFYVQNYDHVVLGDTALSTAHSFLRAGLLADSSAAFFDGGARLPISMINPGQGAAPTAYTNVVPGMTSTADAGTNVITNIATNGSELVFGFTNGACISSPTGLFGSFSYLAAPSGGHETNEFIDNFLIGGWTGGSLNYINDTWWVSGGTIGGQNAWWKYVSAGLPAGHGWVQDNTGPFLQRIITNKWMFKDHSSCKLAYSGYDWNDGAAIKQYVYFDTGDL